MTLANEGLQFTPTRGSIFGYANFLSGFEKLKTNG